MTPIRKIQREHGIVGRDERTGARPWPCSDAGRHLLLEGPVGVGKTTVALAVCAHLGRDTVRVDGDDRYSESKLTGWFDPPLVLQQGYREESFFAGPLVQAMRGGCVLFINELNRMPEIGAERAAAGARRTPPPGAAHRRGARRRRLPGGGHAEPRGVRGHRAPLGGAARPLRAPRARLPVRPPRKRTSSSPRRARDDAALVWTAVRLTRATRLHPRFRKGASVRGAIATVAIAERLWAAPRRRVRRRGPRDVAPRRRGGAHDARRPARRHRRRHGRRARRALRARRRPRRGPGRRPGAARRRGCAQKSERPRRGSSGARRARRGARAPDFCPAREARPPDDAAMAELAARYELPADDLDGWAVAVNFTRSGCRVIDPGLRCCAERLAARAVLAARRPARRARCAPPRTWCASRCASPSPASSTWRRRSTTCSASRSPSPATG